MSRLGARRHHGQRGVVAVEVGLVMTVFIAMLLAVVDLSQLLLTWTAATEATRLGARVAAVCNVGSTAVMSQMRTRMASLRDDQITVDYFIPGSSATCLANSATNFCRAVRVRITGYEYRLMRGLLPVSIVMPEFRTTVPREVMDSAAHPICH
jgi:Flp pilus assembly protein TadG